LWGNSLRSPGTRATRPNDQPKQHYGHGPKWIHGCRYIFVFGPSVGSVMRLHAGNGSREWQHRVNHRHNASSRCASPRPRAKHAGPKALAHRVRKLFICLRCVALRAPALARNIVAVNRCDRRVRPGRDELQRRFGHEWLDSTDNIAHHDDSDGGDNESRQREKRYVYGNCHGWEPGYRPGSVWHGRCAIGITSHPEQWDRTVCHLVCNRRQSLRDSVLFR